MSTTAAPPPAPTPTVSPAGVLGYRALKLWQRALDLAADAHRLAHAFPDADQPALATDLRRAAAAVPSAVAASSLALDPADQQRALQSATAALARLETLAALAERLGSLNSGDASALLFTSGDVNRLLRGFVRAVSARTRLEQASAAAPARQVAEPTPAPAQPPAPTAAPTPPSMRARTRRRPDATAATSA